VLIAINLVLGSVPVIAYPPLLHQHRSIVLLLEPLALLFVYAALVARIARRRLRYATAWGVCSGVFSVAQIFQETYLHSPARTLLTWVFVIGMFLPWLLAGYQARTVIAGVWSAMISMLLTIAFGWSELLWDLPGAIARNLGSPDLARSGWTDLHAFAIADLLQAGFKYLLVGPIIGAVLAGLGVLVAYASSGEDRVADRSI